MLQSLGAYSPWGGQSTTTLIGIGGDKRKRRARRKAKQFGSSLNSSGAATPTGLPQQQQSQDVASEDDSCSGSGSDVEDPLQGSSRSTAPAAHLRPSAAADGQPLYGKIWCTATESPYGPDAAPSSVLESAGFATASWGINILLLLFLLWTATNPRCGDAWLEAHHTSTNQQTGILSATILPPNHSNGKLDLLALKSKPTGEPPEVEMPLLMPLFKIQPNPIVPASKKIAAATTTLPAVGPVSAQKRLIESDDNLSAQKKSPLTAASSVPLTTQQPESQADQIQRNRAVIQKMLADKKNAPAAPDVIPAAPSKALTVKGSINVTPVFQSQVAISSSLADVDAFQRDFDVHNSHRLTWKACQSALIPPPGSTAAKDSLVGAPPQSFCPETSTTEQGYQLAWFGKHVAQGFVGERRFVPEFQSCVQMQPDGYRWPEKTPELPYTGNGANGAAGAVHWPNFRVKNVEELVEFNRGTPKNLYHFKAQEYDQDGLDEMALAAKYIPLKEKIRL
jgi:hypothetical protein